MKTYKVLVCNTSRYYQTVLVQANSEEEAEEKVELEELWRDKSWELDHEHCEVEYVETAEQGEIVECSSKEATHILLNGQVYPLVEKQPLPMDGISFLKNSQTDNISMLTPDERNWPISHHIPIQVFEIFGIKPVKVIE
jgi:hypothetical protein